MGPRAPNNELNLNEVIKQRELITRRLGINQFPAAAAAELQE